MSVPFCLASSQLHPSFIPSPFTLTVNTLLTNESLHDRKFGDLRGVPSNATLTTLIQGSTVAAGAGGEGGGVGGGGPLAAAMGGTPASAAIPNFRNPSTTSTVIVNPKETSRVIHNPLGVNGGVNGASPAAALNRGPLAAGPLGSGQDMRAHPSAFSPKQPSNQGLQMIRQEKDEAALRLGFEFEMSPQSVSLPASRSDSDSLL